MTESLGRRSFAVTVAGLAAGMALPMGSFAQGRFQEGVNYTRLQSPVAVDSAPGQVEVLEFFAYTCIHCYRFEPDFERWMSKQSAGVVVRRVPVAFNTAMEPLQRLYYALESMGLVEKLHGKVFAAIHNDKQRLLSAQSIVAWVVAQGVDQKAFEMAFSGFSASGKAKRASQLTAAYGVEGTPALGVAGRFYIPGQGPKSLDVADDLIVRARTI
ncbi:thiol:disulfide interchange protein DsbA/DsbL [Comamonadaceae bacterium M7527]|nr:thiol:disulfide interchange protein DsbA/DsbL [Comamonadaceae bacterium M7527]